MVDGDNGYIFQVTSWEETSSLDTNNEQCYTIYMCGTTDDDKKICVTVTGFRPYFYVKIPANWNMMDVKNFISHIGNEVDTLSQRFRKNKNINWDSTKKVNHVYDFTVERKHKFTKFTDYKKYKFIKIYFKALPGLKWYERVLHKKLRVPFKGKKSFQLFESNMVPYLRFIHEQGLESCGWVKIDKYEKTTGISNCEIEIETNYKKVMFYESKKIAPLIIASFDLECIPEDGGFPQASNPGDYINQIGTSFSRYGESECFYKHVITLKGCSKVPGTVIESYKSEPSVILAWSRLIKKMNPDIMTGYNIFQFDYEYLKKRAELHGIEAEFCKNLSRINTMKTQYVEKELASSALGDNFLKFYNPPGRTQIDLFKVVQRDYKLSSYSLDNVTSEFIKEKIISVIDNNTLSDTTDIEIQIQEILDHKKISNNTSTIITPNTYGLELEAYIKIYYNDNFSDNIFDNNRKYKIIGLSEITKDSKKVKIIIVDAIINNSISDILADKMNTTYWTQAKDDLKYSVLFEMQKNGTNADRAIIAKYCIKDCVLCNVLMNKLEVLNNNIAMAIVTNVPLSYIFLKGQGIKIFSLVAKKCRERNHLIPTLKVKNKTKEEQEASKVLEKHKAKISRKEAINKKKPKTYSVKNMRTMLNEYDEDSSEGEDIFDINDIKSKLNSVCSKNNNGTPKNIYESDSDDEDNSYYKMARFYNDDNGYEGATVLDPDAGIHHTPIPVLDYASLYPSSMIEGNLSHECLVLDMEKYDTPEYRKRYDFYTVTYLSTDLERTKNIVTFAKLKGDNQLVGILPEILLDLINARSRTRDIMEKTKDPFQKKVLDGLQLAFKITANSLYGQTGASTSPISQKKIAASTTAIGRDRLMMAQRFTEQIFPQLIKPILAKDFVLYKKRMDELLDTSICEGVVMFPGNIVNPSKYNKPKNGYTNRDEFIDNFKEEILSVLENKDIKPKCIYGDSVTGDEPVLIQDMDGIVHVRRIDELVYEEDWKPYDNFKSAEFNSHFVDILNYLFDIKRSSTYLKTNIDSKSLTIHEKSYNYILSEGKYIIYKNGLIEYIFDIADRDLVLQSINIDPTQDIGQKLIDNYIKQLPKIVQEMVFRHRLSFKNGNTNDIRRSNLILLTEEFKFVTSVTPFIEKIISIEGSKQYCVSNYKVWTDGGWQYIQKIIRHKTCKKIYRVETDAGIVTVTEDHSLLNEEKNIIKPESCIINKTKLLYNIPTLNDGNIIFHSVSTCSSSSLSEDKVKCMDSYINLVKTGKIPIIKYDVALRKYIVTENDDENYNLDNYNIITRITDVTDEYDKECYVYDLETSNGHFGAGIGSLILKNTDSIFINFNIFDNINNVLMKDKEGLAIGIKLGILCSRIIGVILPYPQDLQYEKTFWPFIIITKKRYVGKLYTFNNRDCYQKSMGLSLKRRDYAPIAKIIVGKIVNTLLNESDPEKAIICTKAELFKILNNGYAVDKYILSKTLRASYADRTRIVHAVLADRIGERNPGNKPQSNDRIQYVYIVTGKRPQDIKLQGERVEDPEYAAEKNLQLDYLFYITNQILKPSLQFLEYIMENPEKLFNTYINYELNRRTGIKPIAYHFNPEDEQEADQDIEDIIDSGSAIIPKVKSIPAKRKATSKVLVNKKIVKKTIKKKSPKDTQVDKSDFSLEL